MPSSAPTGRDSEKFNLRLPDGMRALIAEAAARNNRSMNSEIVARLEQSFGEDVAARLEYGVTEKVGVRTITSIVNQVVSQLRKDGWKAPR